MGALNELILFLEASSEESILELTPALFVLVKESTSSFKESNFNVAKAIILFFSTLFTNVYAKWVKAPDSYLVAPATKIAVEKIADRKLAESSTSCLTSLCVVKDPQKVISLALKYISEIKSPLAHEALLSWFKSFLTDFGSHSLSGSIQDILAWVLNVSVLTLLNSKQDLPLR